MTLSKEYTAAMDAHTKACMSYDGVLRLYRGGKMDDATYLVARAEMKAADAIFDAAFAAERDRREADEEAPVADDQLGLDLDD